MDAKVGDHVITPRIGKPIEVNALWYDALVSMAAFATRLGEPSAPLQAQADAARSGFERFWNPETGYCYDVLDGPDGHESALRPNQLLRRRARRRTCSTSSAGARSWTRARTRC